MEAIERAIFHAVRAGKLRDNDRQGLQTLADRQSAASAAWLQKVVGGEREGLVNALPRSPR